MNRFRNFATVVVLGGILGLAIGCGSGSSASKADSMKKDDGMMKKDDGMMKKDDGMKK